MASVISAGTTSTTALNLSGDTTGILQLQTNGTTAAMTIDTSQNVGIGATPSAWSAYKGLNIGLNATLAGSTGGSVALLSTNAYFDGSSYKYITTDAATQYQQNTGEHIWRTAASGSAGATLTFSERMRITSGGALLVGASSQPSFFSAAAKMYVEMSGADYTTAFRSTNASPSGIAISYSTTPNGASNYFIDARDNTAQRFAVKSNGGIDNYSGNNTNLSDEREKTNIELAGSYLDKICAIPVKTFNYIDQNLEQDGGLTLGVIAQDVQAVAPELVMESNWASKDQPEKMRLSIYQTDLQYALMKSIQELKAELDEAKAEIQALKGAK